MLEYDTMKDSLFNTPPCYAIYMCACQAACTCLLVPSALAWQRLTTLHRVESI